MPAFTPDKIQHETNVSAKHEVEVVLGNDKILRVNVDGVCALRVRCEPATSIRFGSDPTEEEICLSVF